MNNNLDAPFLEVESKPTLWSLSKASCPREDGLSMIFFQKYWNIIGIWLPKVCNEIFDKCRMLVDMVVGLIYMIPKGEKQLGDVTKWRPITLLNTVYKIYAKALSMRL